VDIGHRDYTDLAAPGVKTVIDLQRDGADFLHPEFKQFVYGYRIEPQQTAPAVLATGVTFREPARSPPGAAVAR
jgi:hypothetical protein